MPEMPDIRRNLSFKVPTNLYYQFWAKVDKQHKTGTDVLTELIRKYIGGTN